MISESQERMVAVVEPERLAAVEAVLDRWELHHAAIGTVTDTGELRCFFHGDLEGAIPASFLTDECPRYEIEQEPQPPRARRPVARENLESKAWIYEQYDQLVQSRTVRRPGFGAAVLRLRPSYRGLAMSLDGPRIGELDPFKAGARAVLASARKVACAGGRPLALTDCLNFGSPEKPEIAWELAEAIEGMSTACEALGIPVVSGNVSLYNDTDGRSIHPTPVVGCVGLVPDVRAVPGTWREGDTIYLAGEPELSFDGSEYQALRGELAGRPAPLDLAREAALVRTLHDVAPRCSLVHDVSEGGLAIALAEAAVAADLGAELDLADDPLTLFGEGGGRAILSSSEELPFPRIGSVAGSTLLGVPIDHLRRAWEEGITT
jgi:phosphoribosylformylglycinamidine synthase